MRLSLWPSGDWPWAPTDCSARGFGTGTRDQKKGQEWHDHEFIQRLDEAEPGKEQRNAQRSP